MIHFNGIWNQFFLFGDFFTKIQVSQHTHRTRKKFFRITGKDKKNLHFSDCPRHRFRRGRHRYQFGTFKNFGLKKTSFFGKQKTRIIVDFSEVKHNMIL